jgi:ATP-binding protein involved in chromosome partitioning
LSEELGIPLLGQIPMVQGIREGGDAGRPIAVDENSITGIAFHHLAEQVVMRVNQRNMNMNPTKKVEITNS